MELFRAQYAKMSPESYVIRERLTLASMCVNQGGNEVLSLELYSFNK